MIAAELAAKVKELELHTRRILSGPSTGASRSAQRGFGFDFDQLRAYQYGDDVRLIDWKSSARSQDTLYIRQYFEERNRTFMVCLDVSASTQFGSGVHSKQEIMQQVAGVLALAAGWSKDKVGLILFSDRVEYMIPPAKGQHHIHRMIEKIFTHQPQGSTTSIEALCQYGLTHVPKKSTMLVVSDFIAPDFSSSLKKFVVSKNFVAISCLDPQETVFSDVGLVWMQDPETGRQVLASSSGGVRSSISQGLQSRLRDQKTMLRKMGVQTVLLRNQSTFMHELISFFKKRMVS